MRWTRRLTNELRNRKRCFVARYRSLDPGWQKLNAKVKEHEAALPKYSVVKALIASEGVLAVRLHSQGEDVLKGHTFPSSRRPE